MQKLLSTKAQFQIDIEDANKNLTYLNTFLEDKKASINVQIAEAEQNAELVMGIRLDEAAERKRQEYIKAIDEAENEYKKILLDCSQELNKELEEKRLSITDLENTLQTLRTKVLSINEENKRAEEIKTKSDFYRLQVSEINLKEIQKLREIGKELHDATPLNKMIWTYYFRNLFNELAGRVIGAGTHVGIYKITNLENGMVYIGQSSNIKDRWATHIKAGLGAEAAARNKLYSAMQTFGVENFTFEILEECSSEQLNEREKFYIEFYDTTNYGYNATRGGS